MCWIHRGMISSAVANVTGDSCEKYLKFILSMLTLLLSYQITPIMVLPEAVMTYRRRRLGSRSLWNECNEWKSDGKMLSIDLST
ncbi:hypothetical protein BEWA_003610 [Theileria equi strain WA]|uniref:Uncharacterized protein n=1 Tax=Theileria equi strain WA TaxID=1537102 RepID=L0B0E3_THEEQ|nr:hypothetical protein BEWA_003610 [Theileria equi strain WA]AFZ80953.1 hypothetical protein BEWA_003610 [Theileria equi strain WA]|eukprot:XP_004830619.1 hypothetical protein BEWA_003610 [Theileria equi strain WA]